MSETERLIVPYAPAESGNQESRWIRVAQVGLQDESLDLDEAAAIIDALFDLEPCDSGMGGGGNAAEDEPPDEDRFKDAMAAMFRRPGMCEEERFWTAQVDILRSHKKPDYELRLTYGEVAGIRQIRESVREVVEVNGAVIELSMPYDGGLSGVPAGVKWEARGSTINLERPINARLTLRYNTWYERATITVPTGFEEKNDPVRRAAREYAPGDIYAVGGYPSSKKFNRPELPESDVIAFWGRLAASCALVRPNAQDESVDSREIWDVCNPQGDGDAESHDEPCIGYVHHYMMCECSRRRIDGEVTTEEIKCPQCGPGITEDACEKKKHRDQFDGYVGGVELCGEDEYDEELQNPEYYKAHCCVNPPSFPPLPRCRRRYALYRGGHEIESGPEHWKNVYGDDVVMRAVLPEDGICGDLITEWNVPQKNCCNGVIPLTADPDNPTHIEPGRRYRIAVGDGKQGILLWKARGGIKFENGGTEYRTGGRAVWIVADDEVCPKPVITVDDGCYPLDMTFQGPESDGPVLRDDMTIGSGQTFQVSVTGGVAPFLWQAGGGLEFLGWSAGGRLAFFKTPADPLAWCMGEIAVADVCGRSATMTVYNGVQGRWQTIEQFDPCIVPGMPFAPDGDQLTGWSMPRRGYRVYYIQDGSVDNYSQSCPTTQLRCPAGMVVDINAAMASRCVSNLNYVREYDWALSCCKTRHRRREEYSSTRYGSYASIVQKWVCG